MLWQEYPEIARDLAARTSELHQKWSTSTTAERNAVQANADDGTADMNLNSFNALDFMESKSLDGIPDFTVLANGSSSFDGQNADPSATAGV